MFDLTIVRDALGANAPSLGQVVLPSGDGSQGVDSAALLHALVNPLVSYGPVPQELGNAPTYPAAVYNLTASGSLDFDTGYPILREDEYLLAVADPDYGDVRTTAESIKAALLAYSQSGGAGTVTVNDQADAKHTELDLRETGLLLSINHLALSDQSLPAAFVIMQGHDSTPAKKYGTTFTEEESRFSVLLVARVPVGGISALAPITEEIQSAIMSISESGWDRPMWYGGSVVAVHNTLLLWRESFGIPRDREFT